MARMTKAELQDKVKVLELELEKAQKSLDQLRAREAELVTLLRYRSKITPKLDRTKVSKTTCVRCGDQVSKKVAEGAIKKLGWTYCIACQERAERFLAWQRNQQAKTQTSSNEAQPRVIKSKKTSKVPAPQCECGVKVTLGVAKYSRDKFGKVLCMPCQRKVKVQQEA